MTLSATTTPVERVSIARRLDAGAILFLIALGALAMMVLLPLAWLFYTSLQDSETAKLGFGNYVTAFTRSIYLTPIRNSFILALSVATVATLIGTPLAWLVSRTNLVGRGLLRTLIIA